MNIIETIVTALTDIVVGSAGAIADGATALLLVQGEGGAMQLSNVGIIIFTLFGLGMGKHCCP